MTKALLRIFLYFLFPVSLCAQDAARTAIDALRDPSWSYGVQVYGGTATMSTPPIPYAPARYPSSFGAEFHAGRVLTNEHGEGWRRGTLEWDFSLIPVALFFVND